MTAKLAALKADTSPFAGKLDAAARRGATFVRPELVAEIAFAEFTADGSVRHASFLGLREDKAAAEVVAEKPAASKPAAAAKRRKAAAAAPQPTASAPDRHGVRVTSPERVVFPELGMTKGALVDYYAVVADVMLKEVAGRPISLVRCPQGRAKTCFFQKHDSGMFSADVHHVDVPEADGKTEPYLYVDTPAGLLNCVQMGTIEFHGWGSRVADLERPDRLVIDLDPDEGLDFTVVKTAAVLVRDRLQERGLSSFPLLTGGKGVHVVAPLVPDAEWPAVKAWARAFAESLEAEAPTAFVANDEQGQAQRAHLRRLAAEPARGDGGDAVLGSRAGRGRRGDPGNLGTACSDGRRQCLQRRRPGRGAGPGGERRRKGAAEASTRLTVRTIYHR